MRRILLLLATVLIGGVAGSWIKNLPGFVIVAYQTTTYEMRLWVAVAINFLFILVLALIIYFAYKLLKNTRRFKDWRGNRHIKRARKLTVQGMLAFSEGRWKDAEEAMVNAAKTANTKLINYLIAAQAAQHQNAETRRDYYLKQASQVEPNAKIAIGLTQAQLQIQHNQYEQALASLTQLKSKNPNHPYVLKLLCQLFRKLQEWEQLVKLLPQLKKQQILDNEQLAAIEEQAINGLLFAKSQAGQLEEIRDIWQNLPAYLRKNKTNQINYARLLIDFQQMEEAEALLKPIIKKYGDNNTIHLYGQLNTIEPARQLNFLESWYQANHNPPEVIYLAMAKLAYRANLWGKARQFLDRAIVAQPTPEVYLFMAKTLTKLNDQVNAQQYYQQGLELSILPREATNQLTLEKGSDDLINAGLLPRFKQPDSISVTGSSPVS
ncbi:heme biosynthesis HemY N-terminal domain-containing protein [Aliikangiella maris]|uniref:Heme biosynthesis HemY N-terminal domain-containing protein n=2 Tax=Aliikangiella maris TaxID=3162458 RepID=A0ABV3MN98_9GAMM